MNPHRRASTLAALAAAALLVPAAAAAAPRVVQIKGLDTMKYSLEKIEAKAGEELTIQLAATSNMSKTEMAHNFVLLAPDTDVNGFVVAASMARTNNYIPKQPKWQPAILAQTAMAGGGETVEVTFKAPSAPGQYPFICTFPGHYNGGMKGVLIVK